MIKGDLVLNFVSRSDSSILMSDLEYQNKKYKVSVKKGLETDGASIPKFLWSIVGSPYLGSYRKAAIIHDGLYRTHKLSKTKSDFLFLEMMKSQNVHFLKRHLIFLGVFLFGWFSYTSKKQSEIDAMSPFVEVKDLIKKDL